MNQNLESILNGKLGKGKLEEIAEWASLHLDNRERLLSIAFSSDNKTSANALWCLTHLRKSEAEWLESKQELLINELLKEKNTAKKRMILQLLRQQDYTQDNIRVDFLDFCLMNINSENEPYAIRCFSLYISIKLCRFYPELLSELEERISILNREPLSPGMKCAIRKVSAEISLLSKP